MVLCSSLAGLKKQLPVFAKYWEVRIVGNFSPHGQSAARLVPLSFPARFPK